MSSWQLLIKDLQGQTMNIDICNPQVSQLEQGCSKYVVLLASWLAR